MWVSHESLPPLSKNFICSVILNMTGFVCSRWTLPSPNIKHWGLSSKFHNRYCVLPFLHARLWVWKSQVSMKYVIIQNKRSGSEGVYIRPHAEEAIHWSSRKFFSYVWKNFSLKQFSLLMYLIHVLEFAWSNTDFYPQQSALCCLSSIDGFRLCLLDSLPQKIWV